MIATGAAEHMGHVQRSVFTKDGIERAIHTTRIGLQAILYSSLLSLNPENAFNTIPRRSFLAELYKNPDLHPIIPLVEMIYTRDSPVYYFDPYDASFMYGTVQSRTGVRQGDPFGPLYLIKMSFVLIVITVATGELGKVCSNIQQTNLRAWYLRIRPLNLLR
jgi:hypothetical protein